MAVLLLCERHLNAAVLCLRPEAAPLDSRVAPLARGEPLGVGCLAVASFPQPLLGALPPPCQFFGGVVVLVVGMVVLVGGVVLVVGVVLVRVAVLRNGVLKVLGAAPLASFRVDPATRAESGAHA
jgi:hypothetical protein